MYLLIGDKSIGKSDKEVKQHIRHYCFHGLGWTLFVGLIVTVALVKHLHELKREALDYLSFIHLDQE